MATTTRTSTWSFSITAAVVPLAVLTVAVAISVRRGLRTERGRRRSQANTVHNDGKRRILVMASGSVAAVKVPELVEKLINQGFYIDLVLTRAGGFFLGVEYRGERGWDAVGRLLGLRDADGTPRLEVWEDEDEWGSYGAVGDTVLHVELAKRNTVLVAAPLCAGTLAQLALGSASGLAASVHRAW